jgi:hypothetical protein
VFGIDVRAAEGPPGPEREIEAQAERLGPLGREPDSIEEMVGQQWVGEGDSGYTYEISTPPNPASAIARSSASSSSSSTSGPNHHQRIIGLAARGGRANPSRRSLIVSVVLMGSPPARRRPRYCTHGRARKGVPQTAGPGQTRSDAILFSPS